MSKDIASDENLKTAITEAEKLMVSSGYEARWKKALTDFLAQVRNRIPDDLADRQFLQYLWEDESVSSTGMGSVKTAPALDSVEFREWFKQQVKAAPDNDSAEMENYLLGFYKELEQRLAKLCGRVPRLKLNRVLCALFPDHFTTLADVGKLHVLNRAMGGAPSHHPIHAHAYIRKRLDEVMGHVSPHDCDAKVDRLHFAWYLYEYVTAASKDTVASPTETPFESTLKPLPAILRRKGLTAMKGRFQSLMNFVQLLEEGLPRDEFLDIIRQENPEFAESGLGSVINSLAREFGLCTREGDAYVLTARGINLLNSKDPDELADHLLTSILGVDHVLVTLRSESRQRTELVALLQSVNPGWKTTFIPTSMLGWLASFDVIEQADVNGAKHYRLTPRGAVWAEKVTWVPESLPALIEDSAPKLETFKPSVQIPLYPDLAASLNKRVAGKLVYETGLIQQLHAGLWFHPIRHFVVLTGISGSGKTQLALNYSLSLCGVQDNSHESVRVIPVQPGWFDPAPLIGYVNPITQSYRSAPFLELLLQAAEDPTRPYVAILDEMNLSHPEQYLAPILSAMETRGWIDLHQLGDGYTDIPEKIQYPANLAIIGTLNMDETTHGLSDKVLDRAYTLEFWNIKVSDFPLWDKSTLSSDLKADAKVLLEGLSEALAPVRLHFGWRTIDDVLKYMEFFTSSELGNTGSEALDAAIYAKVLPKIRGESTTRFEAALEKVHALLAAKELNRSRQKVAELKADLLETGTARFWR